MSSLARITAVVCAFALSFASACGGQAPEPITPASASPERPKPPRNADAIARALAGAQVDLLVYVDRVRGHPLAPKLAALDAWGPILDGTGIDPQKDLERAYVASKSANDAGSTVLVAEHSMPQARLRTAIETLIARSTPSGEWIAGSPVPSARVTVRGRTRVVALVTPSVLVVLPDRLAAGAQQFVGTGGCPDPTGPEAAVATAVDPARSLRVPRAPRVPETIRSGQARLTLTRDGGADLAVVGQSTSAEQAALDAAAMTGELDRATSVSVSVVKIRLFDPIRFSADGDRIKGDRHLSSAEIDRILGLVSAFAPR